MDILLDAIQGVLEDCDEVLVFVREDLFYNDRCTK